MNQPRHGRVVLVTPEGALIGALPPVPVATPWWQDVEPLVAAVRARHGIDITVLRLLEVSEPGPSGIEITYLAETTSHVVASPWNGVLTEHRLRLPYAKPGGPAADLAWAEGILARHGRAPKAATQIRTWNLSSLWRLTTADETFWLKATPPFMAHEGAILEMLAGGPVPTLLGHDNGRILMADIPGEDAYGAQEPELLRMVDLIVALQREWVGKSAELLKLGLNDWRGPVLTLTIVQTFESNVNRLAKQDREVLASFMETLDGRFSAVEACGVPETLVHGDFHPGNLRVAGQQLVLLDWGDSGFGHPLLEEPAFLARVPDDALLRVKDRWLDSWRSVAPGSDPERASELMAPIALLREAAVYQGFLDQIEPSEHPYHRDDPADRLGRAAQVIANAQA